ncbi:hypothetical protein HOU02_gp075 [Caulobacter phage CcrBL9]|uniref:Uncharacterized protein n=1 Tax=Caulobacter phage CcrBL9 TaxID=2283270 RepID=A0A385EEG5_9CAUD|nr:hypothetical protein HOU02_gp075 [Caulobacter phage CcrBL9]AXQ69099.1 hypothetical protein CcrBL9_gp075c [Caulobacter phage CcrBL9]
MSLRPQTDEELIDALAEELSLFRCYVLTPDGWAEMGNEHGPIRSPNRERLERLAAHQTALHGSRCVVVDMRADPVIVYGNGEGA